MLHSHDGRAWRARWARRWSICNLLRHAMCLHDHYTTVQWIGGSWDRQCSESAHTQRVDGDEYGVQVVWISVQFSDLTHDGEEIVTQRCRGAPGRANLLIVNGLLRLIASGELPSAVASQATRWLARGNVFCTAKLVACARRVAGVCQRVSACAEWGNQRRRVSSAVIGPRVPNLSPVHYCVACNAYSPIVSKPMHLELWRMPCQCEACGICERVLANPYGNCMELAQNKIFSPVHCALFDCHCRWK